VFDENICTLRAQALHAKVDQPGVETAKGVRIVAITDVDA
jgi:CRISPR-associated exonuclease Cas4